MFGLITDWSDSVVPLSVEVMGKDFDGGELIVGNAQTFGVSIFMGLQGIEWVVLRGHSGGNACGIGTFLALRQA